MKTREGFHAFVALLDFAASIVLIPVWLFGVGDGGMQLTPGGIVALMGVTVLILLNAIFVLNVE